MFLRVDYLDKKKHLFHKTLNIYPPQLQKNKACFVWEVATFIEGVPSKHFKTN